MVWQSQIMISKYDDTFTEQTEILIWITHFDTRNMTEESFWWLRMIMSTMANSTIWSSYCSAYRNITQISNQGMETKAKQLKAQQCSKNLPPQLNWFPLLYLNLAASLTIYTWYAKFIGSLFWTSFVFNPVKIMYACLIKSRIYIISKLYLCNSSIALEDDIEGRAEEIRKT